MNRDAQYPQSTMRDVEADGLFRLFAESLPTLAWIANPDGYITWYNRRWHEYCGTTPDQMEGWGWQSVHHPDQLENVLAKWQSSIAAGTPFEMTFPLRAKDGTYRPFLTRSEPTRDEAGEIVRWFGTNTDVTPQLEAENALRSARAEADARAGETAAILAQLGEGVIVTDVAGRITFVNEAAVSLHGVERLDIGPEEYSANYHLFTEDGQPYPPSELPLARAVRGEDVRDARWLIQRPDGTEVLAIGNARPILDGDGVQTGAVLTIRDDTARHAAETNLRISEEALRDLNSTLEKRVTQVVAERRILADVVESTDAFIGVLGMDYTILAINRANTAEFERVYGVRPAVGDNMLELLSDQPDHQQQVREFWSRALGGEEYSLEAEFGSAERAFYQIKFNVLRDAKGEQVGAFNIVTDVTQQRRDQQRLAEAEERVQQAQKIEAIGQLTGGVAHDFNNLLMVLSSGLDLLERQGDPLRRERVQKAMRNAVDRGSTLSRQLLAFSRRQPLKPVPISLAQQIDGMRELLDGSLRGDVHVRTEFSDDLWAVAVDPGELELVILNLAVNARDAMPHGGTIVIRGENLQGYSDPDITGDVVRLSVIDEGTGMPAEIAQKAFEPFFTTKEVGKGSGLGLPQALGFAQSSGGIIRIESQPDEGTTIAMLLPRSFGEPKRVASTILSRPVETMEHSGTILIVEDDKEVGALVTEMLALVGYQTICVGDSIAALGALADGRSVDLVLSDVMMAGEMNGVELAREIRKRHPEMPIVLNSGFSGAAHTDAEAMGLDILRKPFTLKALGDAITGALAQTSRAAV